MDAAPAGWLQLDGRAVPFQAGQTLLQAALAAAVDIPHLCYQPELGPIGSCRVCVVEVGGRRLSACTTLAAEGQVVDSDTPGLRRLRTDVLSMLLERGRHVCTGCRRTGDCRLQDAAAALAVPAVAAAPGLDFPAKDDSHPEVALDRSRCILCGVCIQASRELDGKSLFAFVGRAAGLSLAVASASGQLADSAISAADHAVRLCPVGALTLKSKPAATLELSSFDFFDTADWR